MSVDNKKKSKAVGIYAAVYGALLALFTLYVMLDTFVIEREYEVVGKPEISTVSVAGNENNEKNNIEETAADAENVTGAASVTLSTFREKNTTVYVADIVLDDVGQLMSAFANGVYGRNITATTSSMARSVGALIAINGDYYGAQTSGYVIRNGVLYRSQMRKATQEDLVIYSDGTFEIIKEGEITAEALVANGAWQLFCFGPALIDGGEITVSAGDEVGKAMADNPRTAIGMISPLHYVMVVSDGRTTESPGLTLYELACFMKEIGVVTAYNLDGGGSSTMYYDGSVVNNPTTNGTKISERAVSDIVYIGG